MKLTKKEIEVLIVLALAFTSIYVWTATFRTNPYPYGDVDSGTHFTLADYMGQSDKPLYYIPYYLGEGGYKDDAFGKIWYPPQFHTTSAILQIIGKDRIIPILIFHALGSIAIVFSSFFLMRKLYGLLAGTITGFMMIYSLKDIMWFIWGQYPQVFSFGLVPIIVYLFYSYMESLLKEENKTYLYTYALLMVTQFFIHPQGLLISIVVSVLYGTFFIIKYKLSIVKLKTIIVSLVILALFLTPFYEIPFRGGGSVFKFKPEKLNTLRHWYGHINEPHGVPEAYYSFNQMMGNWLLPFIFLGIGTLLLRRKNKDILLLIWLFVFYLSTHDVIIGTGRGERFIQTEAHILFPLAVLGLLAIPKLIKLPSNFKKILKYGSILVFAILFIQINVPRATDTLQNAYQGIGRLTPPQYETAEWMRNNLPEESDIIIMDTMIYTKKKWYQALSFRHIDWLEDNLERVPWNPNRNSTAEYLLLDYSDLVLIGNQQAIQALQQFEQTFLNNSRIVYNNNNIRVYQFV